MSKGNKQKKNDCSNGSVPAQIPATITLSPDELKNIIAEAIIMATQKNDSNTKVNPEQQNTNTKKQSRGFIFKFALGFPFISQKKLIERTNEEDPFLDMSIGILIFVCVLMYLLAIIALICTGYVAWLNWTGEHPEFLNTETSAAFCIAMGFYLISLLCRMTEIHLARKRDTSLALSFLTLFVAVLTLFATVFPFIKTFVKGG